MEKEVVNLTEDYITLGQLLKHCAVVESGGMVKWYLSEFDIFVNDVLENRRGKKLFPGDRVYLPEQSLTIDIQSATL